MELKSLMDFVYILVKENTPFGISTKININKTNASDIKLLVDSISGASSLPIVPSDGIININTIKFFGNTESRLLMKWFNSEYVSKIGSKTTLINVKDKILNEDIAGISTLRIMHTIALLIHVKDDKSFIKYMLNVFNTETKILQLFNNIQGGKRQTFLKDYWLLITGDERVPPYLAYKKLHKDLRFMNHNVLIKQAKKKNQKSFRTKNNNKNNNSNKNFKTNNKSNNKNTQKPGDISDIFNNN